MKPTTIRRLVFTGAVIIFILCTWLLLHQIWYDENCTQVVGTTVCK